MFPCILQTVGGESKLQINGPVGGPAGARSVLPQVRNAHPYFEGASKSVKKGVVNKMGGTNVSFC